MKMMRMQRGRFAGVAVGLMVLVAAIFGCDGSNVPGDENTTPVAADISVTVTQDVAKSVTLPGTDDDGDELMYTIVSLPSRGTLTVDDNVATYTPKMGYVGPDSFTYFVSDGIAQSSVATVTITVKAGVVPNVAPVAANLSANATAGTARAITLSAIDADADDLTYAIVTQPAHGTTSISGSVVTYTANAGYVGSDSFTYKANDGTDASNVATVTITVKAQADPNNAPVAKAVSASTLHDKAKTITLSATDADTDALTYVVVKAPSHGKVTLSGKKATYTPSAKYVGSDSFTYKANDGTDDSNVATVSLTVTNTAPVAAAKTTSTPWKTSVKIALSATDADSDTLTYAIATAPAHGTATISGTKATYTPTAGYFGSDSFTYVANDGAVNSPAAKVTITVFGPFVLTEVSEDDGLSGTCINAIATLADGSTLAAGVLSGTATVGKTNGVAVTLTSAGNRDISIVKYDANGNVVWANRIGGIENDVVNTIAAYPDGSFLIAGSFKGVIDLGVGPFVSNVDSEDLFIARYNADGTIVWAQSFGGAATDAATDLAILSDGSFVVVGYYSNYVNFGTTALLSINGGVDAFVARYMSNGDPGWVKSAGGAGTDLASHVAVTSDDKLYVTGEFRGTATFGTLSRGSGGKADGFVVQYDSNGNVQWVNCMGGSENDSYVDVAVTSDDSCVVLGRTIPSGATDICVAKYAATGNIVWYKQFGGPLREDCGGLVVLSDDSVIFGGLFTGTVVIGSTTLTSPSDTMPAACIVRCNADGTPLWAKQTAGTGVAIPTCLARCQTTDAVMFGGTITIGTATLPNVIFGQGETYEIAFDNLYAGDGFVAKFNIVDGTIASRP